MTADLPSLLAQATDESKSTTERLFAAVALRKQIEALIGTLDATAAGGVTAAVASDALDKVKGQSGSYATRSGTFTAMTDDEARRRLESMTEPGGNAR